jgi:hypothetical protein
MAEKGYCMHSSWLMAATLMLLPWVAARAQKSTNEFLPETDVQVKLNQDVRFVFQAQRTRQGGEPTGADIGGSLEFYMKPLISLQNVTAFDLDDAKARPLVLSIGYRYVPSEGKPATTRIEIVGTSHFPMKGGFLLFDRNRVDLDWSRSVYNWRYRNRLTLEKTIKIGSYHPSPYVSAEFFWESQYSKFSYTAIYAGCLFPVGKHVEFDPYYEHDNNSGKRPNRQIDALGLILNFYFSLRESP